MAATVQARIFTEGSGANAETGIVFNREDSQSGTTPVPKPTATGTNYSWYKNLALYVTAGGGSTSLSNRKARITASPAAGLLLCFKDGGATYVQATGSNKPADNTSANGAVPTGWTQLTTTFQTWDATSVAATNNARNGNFVQVLLGVDATYAGGAGSNIALPTLELQYDEQ